MKPIAVFYHCKIQGSGIPDPEFAQGILYEQMRALHDSGLADAADEIHIGVNGGEEQRDLVSAIVPAKAKIHIHGHRAFTELPTLAVLRRWIKTNFNWLVFYHHSKGVTQLEQGQFNIEGKANHRRVMEKACVWDWKKCVADLEKGYDAVGINLVDPQKRPVMPGRFFAGNFWWATANYLLTLPRIPDNATAYTIGERLMAEQWIGRRRNPRMMDYERPELYR